MLPRPRCGAEPLGWRGGVCGAGGRLLGPGRPPGTRGGEVRVEELGDLVHLRGRGDTLGQPGAPGTLQPRGERRGGGKEGWLPRTWEVSKSRSRSSTERRKVLLSEAPKEEMRP